MGSTQTKSKARPRPKSAQATQRASVKETGTSFKSPTGAGDQKGRDVMISYSHQDVDVMRKIESALVAEGVSVWVDENAIAPGTAFLREIGEAIVASRIFIVLLSADSVQSKYCQDEVSLAYISNKSIFAVSILPYEEVSEVMDLGMKLTLSCVQWTMLQDGDESVLKTFVSSVKSLLDRIELENNSTDEVDSGEPRSQDESTDDEVVIKSVMNKQALRYRLKKNSDSTLLPESVKVEDSATSDKFWNLNFGDTKVIEWGKFIVVLKSHMTETWSQLNATEEMVKHLVTLMAKEMNVTDNKLRYKDYMTFCTKGKEVVALDEAISLFATAAIAVREVFQIDSSVRLTAIEHLGDHKSKAVINVLLDLLYDEDQDVRVVAAISLAHAASEIKSIKTRSEVVNGLLSCLSNDDRLVRESGCLALGRMKSKAAIKKLVHLWRNDYISTVREAAKIAIEQIGGDDAEQALHVTRVLGEEIAKLRKT